MDGGASTAATSYKLQAASCKLQGEGGASAAGRRSREQGQETRDAKSQRAKDEELAVGGWESA